MCLYCSLTGSWCILVWHRRYKKRQEQMRLGEDEDEDEDEDDDGEC